MNSFSAATDELPPSREEHRPAFEVFADVSVDTPLIFASPHSGRFYPKRLMRAAVLDAEAIRRSEDVLVDDLISSARTSKIPLLTASYVRAFIDVNREPYELDQSMFSDQLPDFASIRTARVAAGLGSIARVVAEGQEIYREKLLFAEAKERIETVHHPYHDRLKALISSALNAFGMAVLIDWHSMPSAAAGGDARHAPPDVVLGDRFGAACAPLVTELLERQLRHHGYRVARNTPYAGGYTTEFYGRPSRGIHAVQIELNRQLYLDEKTLLPHEGFGALKERLGETIAALAGWDWRKLDPSLSPQRV